MLVMKGIPEKVSTADVPVDAILVLYRFMDRFFNIKGLLLQFSESMVNEVMSAEADQLLRGDGQRLERLTGEETGHVRGTLTLRIPNCASFPFPCTPTLVPSLERSGCVRLVRGSSARA